jgi:hypothetical protein
VSRAFGGPEFAGFISTQPITSFMIMGGGYPTVENFSFGVTLPPNSISAAPEPSVCVLTGIGISVLSLTMLRRRLRSINQQ